MVDRLVPGMAEQMRAQTVSQTAMAMTSRQVVGIRGQTLIVNFPGSPKAVQECMDVLMPVLPHVLEVLAQPRTDEHRAAGVTAPVKVLVHSFPASSAPWWSTSVGRWGRRR